MEKQSKAFHIWKAVEMAAKARAEALTDNHDADAVTAFFVKKLLSELPQDDDILTKLQKYAEQPQAAKCIP
ncbi:TPA: hypothetical protein ACVU43_003045 [Vibrio parahaemolyticus]|nr:hypothetical protein [Vibrio parahaemolyticus]